MSQEAWPRLQEILPQLTPDDRRRLAAAYGLPAAEPSAAALEACLTDTRQVRGMIRALSERALHAYKHCLAAQGRLGNTGTETPPAGSKSLIQSGLALPFGGSHVLPLEIALAAEELLPEETLLRFLAKGREEDLQAWLVDLLALLGAPARTAPPFLPCAAEIYTLLTADPGRLLAQLTPAARQALQSFGPAAGLLRRKVFFAQYEPELAAETMLSPGSAPAGGSGILRSLLLRGLIASSGSAWQPGTYLHIPRELRPAALASYYRGQEMRGREILQAALEENHQPAGTRAACDGPAALRRITAAVCCLSPHLTQKGFLAQSDLENMAKTTDLTAKGAEAFACLALGLGLVHVKDGRLVAEEAATWPAIAASGSRALAYLSGQPLNKETPASADQDFLSFLRLTVLAVLAAAEIWLRRGLLLDLILVQPGLGRWLEYYWGMHPPAGALEVAVDTVIETLSLIGAVESERDAAGNLAAARLLPWGRSFLAKEIPLAWPPGGPLLVTASHEIYAPMGAGPGCLARLGGFASLQSAGPTMVFRLTRASLLAAAARGLALGAELAWLESCMAVELPQNVRANMLEVAGRQGEVRLGAAGAYLEFKDPAALAAAKRILAAANQLLAAETATMLILAPGTDPPRLARELRKAGLLVETVESGEPSSRNRRRGERVKR